MERYLVDSNISKTSYLMLFTALMRYYSPLTCRRPFSFSLSLARAIDLIHHLTWPS